MVSNIFLSQVATSNLDKHTIVAYAQVSRLKAILALIVIDEASVD
jgi:hypothetical protein